MFAIDKENERNLYEVDGRKKDTSKCGDCHRIHIYYAFQQIFAQAKKDSLNNLSLLVLFLLPMFTLSLSSYFTRAYIYIYK